MSIVDLTTLRKDHMTTTFTNFGKNGDGIKEKEKNEGCIREGVIIICTE